MSEPNLSEPNLSEPNLSEPNLDDELIHDYLAECREHLATIETDLLAIEQGGRDIDEQLVNRVFRAAHSIKGGAGFFDLSKIRELAHRTENALDLVRSRQMIPTPEGVSIHKSVRVMLTLNPFSPSSLTTRPIRTQGPRSQPPHPGPLRSKVNWPTASGGA
jgi:HPt (histidine-containing phosphotransfer) domain-containing protein